MWRRAAESAQATGRRCQVRPGLAPCLMPGGQRGIAVAGEQQAPSPNSPTVNTMGNRWRNQMPPPRCAEKVRVWMNCYSMGIGNSLLSQFWINRTRSAPGRMPGVGHGAMRGKEARPARRSRRRKRRPTEGPPQQTQAGQGVFQRPGGCVVRTPPEARPSPSPWFTGAL